MEYEQAWLRTEKLGLTVPSVRSVVAQDCLDMDQIAPILQESLGELTLEQVAAQCIAINLRLIPLIKSRLGVSLVLTVGWFEHAGNRLYEHGEELLLELLKGNIGQYHSVGFPLHCWLTSPAYEVLDVTLWTTIGSVSPSNRHLIGQVIYNSRHNASPDIIYHPTVVGEEFILRSGVAIEVV